MKTEDGPLTGRTAEAALHRLIRDECLDDSILRYVLPEGRPHAWEDSLWDYKCKLPATSGKGPKEERADDARGVLELVKDVVAFHNSYGGIIVAGVDQYAAAPLVGCNNLGAEGFTVEKLNEQVKSYTRRDIRCRFRSLEVGPGCVVGILLVPQRPDNQPPIRFVKGAPEEPGRKPIFKKGDIYARIGDACRPIHADLQGIQFVCSPRLMLEGGAARDVEDNLPPKDPGLIRFVGRTDYLLELWAWLLDRHSPVKVLTAWVGPEKHLSPINLVVRSWSARHPGWKS